jgi:hypothetical protein
MDQRSIDSSPDVGHDTESRHSPCRVLTTLSAGEEMRVSCGIEPVVSVVLSAFNEARTLCRQSFVNR